MRPSAEFLMSAISFFFLSADLCWSASAIIFWISCSVRPDEATMRVDCCLPVPRCLALTCAMPLASMSKATSICGTPRGAGGMPTSSKRASVLLSVAISRSPCRTCTLTMGWLSTAVEKTCDLRAGMVVFRRVLFRGLTTRAFDVRGGIRLISGRKFKPGLYELVAGDKAQARYGLGLGKTVKIQKHDWTVVGVFTSEGSGFESELWGDIDVMAGEFHREGGPQSLVLRLSAAASLPSPMKDIA